jgi:two-component system copper resistance phosphate regulon response regulator CusR
MPAGRPLRILLVEDEPQAAQMLALGLAEQHYLVDWAPDGNAAVEKTHTTSYDLIILDLLLPGRSGLDVCRELRRSGMDVPILMLTAKDTVDDRITGLDQGADDYMTKPFEYAELLARIRALLRRGAFSYQEEIRIGDLQIDLRTRRVTRSGKAVELSAKEYAVLEYLALRTGELVTREDISEHVWDENFNAFTNLIEVYVLRVRRKIDSGHAVKLIRTRRGEGYVLSAEQ